MLNLGLLLQKELELHASIGPCRCDLKVNHMVAELGADLYSERVMHGIPTQTAIIHTNKMKHSIDTPEWTMAQYLWKTRTDTTTHLVSIAPNTLLRAAI